ncbi:GyrI-like domain-containing protein [uncultured Clostridium sp.]|uniref:GyrI-like domain-containing protein n=1 Tax=uncultured Clostridium sp. TaxID=59620 RepID=UPI0025EFC259|nr:GyrI-like domain-containing protein [uncultured Clostridium sp.]
MRNAKLSLNSYVDLETSLRQLEKDQEDTVVWIGKVGVGISKEKLDDKKYNEYDIVFVILDKEDIYTGETEIWKEETCATLRFCGSHKDASKQYEKLMNFIEKHKMHVSGFSREITMVDDGLTNDEEQFVTEIQIPVQMF